jgi:RNA polymerase sigma factor (sigma-70 family)
MDPKMNTRDRSAISDLSEQDLLRLMAQKVENQEVATLAFEELYRRHHRYLYYVAVKKLGLKQESDRHDLVQSSFLRVYEKAHKYEPSVDTDENQSIARFLKWLGVIARHILIDMHRKQRGIRLLSYEDQEVAQQANARVIRAKLDYLETSRSPEMAAIQAALDNLSEREQHIIRVTWQHHERGKKQQRLPPQVIDELARIYEVTPTYIRKLRERAMESIRNSGQVQARLAQIAKEKSNEQHK